MNKIGGSWADVSNILVMWFTIGIKITISCANSNPVVSKKSHTEVGEADREVRPKLGKPETEATRNGGRTVFT